MQWFMPVVLAGLVVACGTESAGAAPLGTTGLAARYSYAGNGQLPGSVVKAFTIALGQAVSDSGGFEKNGLFRRVEALG